MKKKIIQNYLYSLTYQVLTVLVPLITTPYISRILTSSEVGLYDYSLTICTYFMFLASAGIPTLAQREVALNDKNLSEYFSYYYLFRLTLTIIICGIYYIVSVLLFDNKLLFLVQGIGLLASGFDISWYYAGQENFKTITNRNILFKVASVIFLFAFVRGKNALIFYALSITVPNLIGNLLLFWKLDVKVVRMHVTLNYIVGTLKKSVTLLIPSLVLQLYAIVDKTILGALSTMSELGYYSQVFKIVNLLALTSSTFGTVIFPQMVRTHNKSKEEMCKLTSRSLDVIIHLFLLPVFGIAACADVFSEWFYGNNYVGIDQLLILAMPIIIFKALNYITANQAMVASNREKELVRVICVGTVLNCVLDILLVKPYGAKGAIVATIVSEFIILIVSVVSFKNKEGNIRIINKNCVRATIAAIVVYIVISILKPVILVDNMVAKTFLLAVIGTSIYIFLLKVLRNDYYLYVEKMCMDYIKKEKAK